MSDNITPGRCLQAVQPNGYHPIGGRRGNKPYLGCGTSVANNDGGGRLTLAGGGLLTLAGGGLLWFAGGGLLRFGLTRGGRIRFTGGGGNLDIDTFKFGDGINGGGIDLETAGGGYGIPPAMDIKGCTAGRRTAMLGGGMWSNGGATRDIFSAKSLLENFIKNG